MLTDSAEPEQQIRHEHRDKPGEGAAVVGLHHLDVGIAPPQRVGRFHQRGAELAAEHILDLARRRRDDRFLGL